MMQVAFSSMTPTAFISAMTRSGGSKADYGTFADTTIDAITKAVTAQQAILGSSLRLVVVTHPPPTIDVVRRYRCGDTTVSMCGGMPRALLLLLSYTPLLLLLM